VETYCWLARRRLLGHYAGLCVQALGGDLNTAWRLSFSDESALEVSVTQDHYTNRRLTCTLSLPYTETRSVAVYNAK